MKVHGNKAVIAWSSPVDGGSAITGYLVTVNGKARSVAATAHRLVLTKLKPGVYKVQVAARNVLGYGPGSVTVKFRVE
ncbi:fibronectin type III domain-containing protein [Nocardioides ungokensis]|uniref:fibronectin type III domain-containing protein n=1 Tax=Nocardioides ungokensis TaxID=1643322 RepID=UPI0015DE9B58|nr:fibronectin type III domain-containing protein [Nocardioides ungokensis]